MKKVLAGLILACILAIIPAFFLDKVIFGQKNTKISVVYEKVNPKDGLNYTLKRLREKLTLLVLSPFPLRKADYYEKLLNIRLAELKYVVDNKEIENIEASSQRYSATAGKLTEFILKNNTSSKDKVKELLAGQLTFVKELKKSYNDTAAEWRFVKYDEDYLNEYISQL